MAFRWRLAAGIALLVRALPLAAQTDYRNLDDERPVQSEDAQPIEYRALELMLPVRWEGKRGGNVAVLSPEVMAGVWRNGMVGAKAPLARRDPSVGNVAVDLAGLQLFALHNFNVPGRILPALALRADVTLPVGGAGGGLVRGQLKAIATQNFGRMRAHVNAAHAIGAERELAAVDAIPRWFVTGAVDWSLLRQSLLFIAELGVSKGAGPGAPTGVAFNGGLRWQWTPTLVLDAGFGRRLTRAGDDLALTVGLSQTFGVRGWPW